MSILGTIREKELKHIGANVPPEFHSYLTLYSLAKGTNKSLLLQDILQKWLAEKEEEENDEMLLEQIVQRVNEQWKEFKEEKPELTFQKFKQELRRELDYKGLLQKYIDMILFEIKEG